MTRSRLDAAAEMPEAFASKINRFLILSPLIFVRRHARSSELLFPATLYDTLHFDPHRRLFPRRRILGIPGIHQQFIVPNTCVLGKNPQYSGCRLTVNSDRSWF